jgi:hypothetical protein
LRAEWTGCKEARPCNFGDEWEKIREDAFNEGWGDKILFLREQVPEDFAEEP